MIDESYSSELRDKFSGAWLLIDAPDVRPPNALISQNVTFLPGQVATRLGFSVAYDGGVNPARLQGVRAMTNWISSLGNFLVWYRAGDTAIFLWDIVNDVSATLSGGSLAYAAIFADAGARLYCAFFNTSGLGAGGASIISFQAGSFVQDLCFLPPITYTPAAPSEPGAGTITQGLHYLGYRIEYRTGFVTRPSPDSGVGTPSTSTFQPVSFTASGGANARWTLNTAWPAGAVKVHVVMTPVSNPAQYFLVPGAYATVVGGTTMSVDIDLDISDDLLFAQGSDSTAALFLMTNSVLNVPQIFPSVVVAHGDRMSYVTTVSDNVGNQSGAVYMSDKNAFQSIAPDKSLIQLPGLKDIVTAISLDGVYYMFGPQWTFRTSDNGSDPVTWAAPQLVDLRRGTLAPRGATVAPSGTYGWVASQDGLYYFPGKFGPLPISYYQQPDWDRINWDAAYCVDIKDEPGLSKVTVLAALDGATAPSHMMTWDYAEGFEPDDVLYSLDAIQSYDLGAMAVVKNGLPSMPDGVAQKEELWVADSSVEGKPILRRNSATDTRPHTDNQMPIFDAYETALFPRPGTKGEVYQHHGSDYRVKGTGPFYPYTYTLDHAQERALAPITLSERPGKIIHRSFDMISEGVSHYFTRNLNLISDPSFEGS